MRESRSRADASCSATVVDKLKEFGHDHLLPVAFHWDEEKRTMLCVDPKGQLVGEWSDEEELQSYLSTLVPWNSKCMFDGLSVCAWRELPVTYIQTLQDGIVPIDYQKSMVAMMEKEGRSVQVFELQTAHCPNLTAPDQVVDLVNKVAA